MITYERGCLHIVARAFYCRGSVFPTSLCIALPCAVVTALLKFLIDQDYLPSLNYDGPKSVLTDNSAWSGFVFLVGFLIVFRTSQAYARFWDGCTSMHRMRAEWFDACAALIAFCRHTKADEQRVANFEHILVRLFSMLHAVALADVEDSSSDEVGEVAAFKYELVDAGALDLDTLRAVKKSPAKVELVFQWIQQLVVENIDTGVLCIPPPILSRAFQEIANGMVAFHDAMRISSVPFPFPYAQTCELLLMFHWVCTPLVVSQYVSTWYWGALFSFLSVFIYWSLNFIAIEIENPFGMDANDIDAHELQAELNMHLVLLLDPDTKRTPSLSMDVVQDTAGDVGVSHASLADLWREINSENLDDLEVMRRIGSPQKVRVGTCCCFRSQPRLSQAEERLSRVASGSSRKDQSKTSASVCGSLCSCLYRTPPPVVVYERSYGQTASFNSSLSQLGSVARVLMASEEPPELRGRSTSGFGDSLGEDRELPEQPPTIAPLPFGSRSQPEQRDSSTDPSAGPAGHLSRTGTEGGLSSVSENSSSRQELRSVGILDTATAIGRPWAWDKEKEDEAQSQARGLWGGGRLPTGMVELHPATEHAPGASLRQALRTGEEAASV